MDESKKGYNFVLYINNYKYNVVRVNTTSYISQQDEYSGLALVVDNIPVPLAIIAKAGRVYKGVLEKYILSQKLPTVGELQCVTSFHYSETNNEWEVDSEATIAPVDSGCEADVEDEVENKPSQASATNKALKSDHRMTFKCVYVFNRSLEPSNRNFTMTLKKVMCTGYSGDDSSPDDTEDPRHKVLSHTKQTKVGLCARPDRGSSYQRDAVENRQNNHFLKELKQKNFAEY